MPKTSVTIAPTKALTVAVAPKAQTAITTTAAKPAAAKKRMVCPQTGCTASSCHGAHHQSASSYYN
jgi:hypothetical protein